MRILISNKLSSFWWTFAMKIKYRWYIKHISLFVIQLNSELNSRFSNVTGSRIVSKPNFTNYKANYSACLEYPSNLNNLSLSYFPISLFFELQILLHSNKHPPGQMKRSFVRNWEVSFSEDRTDFRTRKSSFQAVKQNFSRGSRIDRVYHCSGGIKARETKKEDLINAKMWGRRKEVTRVAIKFLQMNFHRIGWWVLKLVTFLPSSLPSLISLFYSFLSFSSEARVTRANTLFFKLLVDTFSKVH